MNNRRRRGKSMKSVRLVEAAQRILAEIHPASVRAVCYRLFIDGFIASMDKANTNRVSAQLTWAREQGVLPWDWIVDETRAPERTSTWTDAESIMASCLRNYRRDNWREQPYWVELWSEKGTVRGTLSPILDDYGITFRVMHGHGSATAVYAAADETKGSPKPLTILYVGDHDPSGMHMSQIDLPRRLARYGGNTEIIRVAIAAMDTASSAGVPSFAAKTADPRHAWYVEHFGGRCWELDALNPVVLRNRVKEQVLCRLDLAAWQHGLMIETAERDSMTGFFARWPSISGHAKEFP